MTAAAGTRSYHSPRRARQAAETRAAVLAAAAECFAATGWAATSVRDIADAAEVSVETIYATYGSKIALLLAAVEARVVGDLDPLPLADRPEFAALAGGAPRDRALAVARLATDIYRRSGDLQLTLREAAASDAEAAARLEVLETQQRADVGRALELVADGPIAEQARDGLWAIGTVEVYAKLTGACGWDAEQYEAWIADVVVRLLEPEHDR